MVIFILKCLCIKYVLCASAKLCTVVEASGAQGTPVVTMELLLSFGEPETIRDEILWIRRVDCSGQEWLQSCLPSYDRAEGVPS